MVLVAPRFGCVPRTCICVSICVRVCSEKALVKVVWECCPKAVFLLEEQSRMCDLLAQGLGPTLSSAWSLTPFCPLTMCKLRPQEVCDAWQL